MAIARRFATDATALLIPEATPVSCAGTASMTVAVKGATVTTIPNPSIAIEPRNSQYDPFATVSPINPMPNAAIAGPMIKGNRQDYGMHLYADAASHPSRDPTLRPCLSSLLKNP